MASTTPEAAFAARLVDMARRIAELERVLQRSATSRDFVEIGDPGAPAANRGRLYVRDNGSGKSQLVVRFATGAVQVLATEP